MSGNLFKREYQVRYRVSHDDGDTFHPASAIVVTTSAHNAKLQIEKRLWEDNLSIAFIDHVEAI